MSTHTSKEYAAFYRDPRNDNDIAALKAIMRHSSHRAKRCAAYGVLIERGRLRRRKR